MRNDHGPLGDSARASRSALELTIEILEL
jgi:hypothetical protein